MRLYKLTLAVIVGSYCSLSASRASAQFLGPREYTQHGFQIERFEPTIAGESTFGVERPWYSSTRWFAAGFTLDLGHGLAWIGTNRGDADTAIDNQFVGHVDLAGSFLDRFLIGFTLPVTLYETGHLVNGAEPLGPSGAVGVGDPRFSAMLRLFGHSDRSPLSMHLGVDVWVPSVGDRNQQGHDGDAGARVMPKLVLAGRVLRTIRWAFNFGYYWRDDAKLTTLPTNIKNIVGDEVRAGIELGFTSRDNRFNIGPELWFSTHALNDKFFHKKYTSIELIVGAHYLIADTIRLGFAFGGAPLEDIGTPDYRVLFRIAYAPVRHPSGAPRPVTVDSDGDGIPDREDACSTTPGVPTTDPSTNGCPAPPPDRDQDGIVDADDLCPDEPAGDRPDPKRPGCRAKDSDNDGVYDYQDQCPDTPAGLNPDPAKKGCPAIDSDGDGLFDYEDKCPQVPAGVHPETDPSKKGCPKPDRDHDTVPDDVDACPDQPGAPSSDPKKNGCPGLVEVKGGLIVIFQPVFFATNKDTILPMSFAVLNAVADALKAEPEIKKVMIEGHTDNRGKVSRNMELSDRRARSVLKYLVLHGVASDRLDSQGYGDSKPVAPNSTAKGRAANRRVEFHIVEPPMGGAKP